MTDLVVRAPRRPLPGETLVGSSFERFLGGKGFNQAVAAARAGAATTMIGRLGADDYGAAFLDALAADGIDARHVVVDPDGGTGIGLPLVEDSGENSIVIVPRANAGVGAADAAAARDAIAAADVLLLQLELPAESAREAAAIARAAGTYVVLDPAPAVADLSAFAGLVDLLVPNEGEAATASGVDGDPAAQAAALAAALGCAVVVTLGAEGVLVLDGAGPERVAGHAVDVVDSVGAGDTFCGVLGARLALGDDLGAAVVRANAAAALCVTRAGAEPSIPTVAAVDALLAAR
jgi:ribokinase